MKRKPLRTLISEYTLEEFYKSGLTVREFAEKLQIPPTTLQKLKNNEKSIRSDSIDGILNGLGVSLIDIVNRCGEYESK